MFPLGPSTNPGVKFSKNTNRTSWAGIRWSAASTSCQHTVGEWHLQVTKIVSVVRMDMNSFYSTYNKLYFVRTVKNITCNRDRYHRSPLIRSAVGTTQNTMTA